MNSEIHLKSPGNWINDPNGFIFYNGEYHLFYQYFPYAPIWGTMHWGHAVSKNLMTWEHLGVSVFPSKSYDRNGIFSGSAIEKDGELYLYYSAVRYINENQNNIHTCVNDDFETCQALITSKDGLHFDNINNKKVVIPVCRDNKKADATHTRDPKVWYYNGKYYMILGTSINKTQGRVIFYQSNDGINWEYTSMFCGPICGKIPECPDLFKLDDQWIFICSSVEISAKSNQCVCAVADFDTQNCHMNILSNIQYVDLGLDLYAAQTNLDKDGNRVLIGWMRMPKPVEESGKTPWIGMMCIPRVVQIKKGHIYFSPHPEADKYFSNMVNREFIDYSKPFRIKTQLYENESLDICGYKISLQNECVYGDRRDVFPQGKEYITQSHTPPIGKSCNIDVFVDNNLIEIFINNGQYVISHVVYGLKPYVKGKINCIYSN